jgi:predicted aldo/keto reductase-like oxidoreductase
MKKSGMSRRQFIGSAASGAVGAGLAGPILAQETRAADSGGAGNELVYRTLGRTGLKIPLVSFGVMNSDNPDLLRKAFDLGLNHLDTAHLYLRGNSERVIGEVVESVGNRDKVYIATKMRLARDREKLVFTTEGTAREPGASGENLFSQLETSLERLRTDYVDILYLHSCYSPEMATFEPLMTALVKAKEQGKARFIGVSTHSDEPNVIRAAVDTGVYDVVLTSYNFVQEHKDAVREAIAYAAGKGVGVIAMKTQGGRRLQQQEDIEVNHRAALKWVLNDENVCTTIPGMTTFDQMDLNYSVMADLKLTEAEQRDLKLASLLPGAFFCQGCRRCIPSCPQRVDIPTLMRAYMYSEAYENRVQAGETLASLPRELGLETCAECDSCTATCHRGLPIGTRVGELSRSNILA